MREYIRYLALWGFFILLMSIGGRIQAQDPVFSQFYSAPTLLNPAFAGTTNAPRLGLIYRNQWSSIFNAYQTYAFTYDQHIEQLNSGFGVSFQVDQAGDGVYNTGQFNLIYAYRVPITETVFVKGGVQAGLYQVSLDWNKLVFLDQLNPIDGSAGLTEENRPGTLNKGMLDVSAGLLIYSKVFYGGFSVFHVNTPDQSLLDINPELQDGLPVRMSLHGGMQISLSKDNKSKMRSFISPNVMYTRQQDFQQVNLGAYLGYGALYGGLWYRHTFGNPDAAIFSLGVSKGVLKLGYSYDLTISALSTQSNGTHEVSLALNFDNGKRRPINYNDCLDLFR